MDQDSPQQPTETQGDPADPFLGRVIVGKFRLEKLLGVGAMGRVYEAEHLSLSKRVAVKVLHKHLAGDEGLGRRFHREAKSASTLNHPNSISIMDFGQDSDGTLYITMEFLEGRSLSQVIREEAPLSLERSVRILSQVCQALDEAHHNKIVHRDLKAENVMVMDRRDDEDFVKVCDFGIAKVQDPKADNPDSAITVAGMVCGTPEYMSPEQARGDPLDGRSDLYSLGILLYLLVTDRLPFTAESALGCVTKHLTEQPLSPRDMRPDLNIPPVLDTFILRTIAKDPNQRPANATAFRLELEEVAAQIARGELGAEEAAPETPFDAGLMTDQVERVPPPRRSRVPLLLLGIVLLLAAGAVIYVLSRSKDPAPSGSTPVAGAPKPDAAPQTPPRRAVAADASVAPPGISPDAGAVAADASAGNMAPRRRRRRRRRPRDTMRPAPTMTMRAVAPRPGKSAFQEAYDKARAAFNAGQVSAAVRHYKAALRLKPGHARSIKELGRCYVRLNRPCRALRYYKRYARMRPGDFFVKRHIRTLSPKCGGK